jgi:hypothetical protein
LIEDQASTSTPKSLLTADNTLKSLKSFLLNETVFQNFTLLVISQSVILCLCLLNLIIFLSYVRNKETTKFVRNNILIFSIIIFICCIWNMVNLISNYNIHYDQADTLIAIKGNNGAVGGRLNDLFGFLIGEGGTGLGGIVGEWVYGNGQCGDAITEDLFERISSPFDLAFFGKS